MKKNIRWTRQSLLLGGSSEYKVNNSRPYITTDTTTIHLGFRNAVNPNPTLRNYTWYVVVNAANHFNYCMNHR